MNFFSPYLIIIHDKENRQNENTLSTEFKICWLYPLQGDKNLPAKKKKLSWYDIKLHLMVSLCFWTFVKCGVLLHFHYSQVYLDPKWSYLLESCRSFWKLILNRIVWNYHHVVPPARISLTLSRHFSLLFIASGRSSGLHPVSSHSCCMYVRAGRPAFAWPYVGVHWSTSLMSSSLLLQQCPACLVRLTCIVFVMGGKWPYSWCLVGCCRQVLFNIALSILV